MVNTRKRKVTGSAAEPPVKSKRTRKNQSSNGDSSKENQHVGQKSPENGKAKQSVVSKQRNAISCPKCGYPSTMDVEMIVDAKKRRLLSCAKCYAFFAAPEEDSKDPQNENSVEEQLKTPSPKEIKQHLDDRVMGQDVAKKVLSVAVYNHYMRINHNLQRSAPSVNPMGPGGEIEDNGQTKSSVPAEVPPPTTQPEQQTVSSKLLDEQAQSTRQLQKSNILMLGPSGTGKTLLAETIAKFLDVPFASIDCTTLTQAGYVGANVESVIDKLLQSANNR